MTLVRRSSGDWWTWLSQLRCHRAMVWRSCALDTRPEQRNHLDFADGATLETMVAIQMEDGSVANLRNGRMSRCLYFVLQSSLMIPAANPRRSSWRGRRCWKILKPYTKYDVSFSDDWQWIQRRIPHSSVWSSTSWHTNKTLFFVQHEGSPVQTLY